MSSVFPITDDPRYRRYTASAGQRVFPIPFPFQQDEDVEISLQVAPSEYNVFEKTEYALIGANDPAGGTVTFNTGRTEGDVILVLGKAILDRMSSVVRDGRFSSYLIDSELDRIRIIEQEFRRDASRAIKVDYGADSVTLANNLEDGDTLMKEGDRLVKGPQAQDIAEAQGYAADALASKEASAVSAAQALAAEAHAVEVTQLLQAEVDISIAEMESKLEGAAEGLADANTWAELAANPGTRVLQPGRVSSTATGTHTDPVTGVVVPDRGRYQWSGSGWKRIGDVADAESMNASIDLVKAGLQSVNDDIGEEGSAAPVPVVLRPTSGTYSLTSNHAGFALGLTVGGAYLADKGILTAVRFGLIASATLDHFVLTAWRRPAGSANLDDDPGDQAGDVELWTMTVPLAATRLIAGDAVLAGVSFEFPSVIDLETFAVGDVLMIGCQAYTAAGVGVAVGWAYNTLPIAVVAHDRGWFTSVAVPDNWGVIGSNNSPAYVLLSEGAEIAPVVGQLDSRSRAMADALAPSDVELISRAAGAAYAPSNGYGGVAFGIVADDVAAGTRYDGFTVPLSLHADTATVTVSLWRRDAAVTAANDPVDAADVPLEKVTLTPAQMGLTPGSGSLKDYRHLLKGWRKTPATGFDIVTIEARNAAGALLGIGWGQAAQSGWSSQRKGWFRSNTTSNNWGPINSTAVAFRLIREGYTVPSGNSGSDAVTVPTGYDRINSVSATALGNSAVVSVNLTRMGSPIVVTQTLPITLPAPIVVTGEARTISMAADLAYGTVGADARLDYPGVTALSIAGLTEGVDYDVNYVLGAIRHKTANGVAVSVNYTGSLMAVDAVVLDRGSLALSVIAGEARGRDALEKRAQPANQQQVVVAYVVKTQRGIYVAPRHFGDISERYRDELNRIRSARLRGKMMRSETINIAGTGDSIMQLGDPTLASYTAPNGPYRDVPVTGSYLNPNSDGIQSDITGAYPLYTSVQLGMPDDGAGAVHSKLGAHWVAIDAIQKAYDCPVNFFNTAIGGTTSASNISNGRPNGSEPGRLAALNAVCAAGTMDALIVSFGMNSNTNTNVDEDLVAIANAVRAVHPDVTLIFTAQAKPNEVYRSGDAWQQQARQIQWAADYVGAVYIDMAVLWGNQGGPGLLATPTGFECSTTYVNHPGIAELRGMGELIARAMLP